MSPAVVVAGGGYAGTAVAKALDDDADVVLVDPRDAFVNIAGSMRALVRPEWADRPFFDYATLLRHGQVIRDAVASVDDGGVTLAGGGRVDADYIVLATGSSQPYPARPRSSEASASSAAEDLRATQAQLAGAEHVLILGAGPVGLELAGEVRDAWPDKRITLVDPSPEVLAGYLPEVRDELRRQLRELDIDLRLSTHLRALPTVEEATNATVSVTTNADEEITADIWFRSFGARPNTDYLGNGALVDLTERRTVPVDELLRVIGHANVYALGDIADLPDAKMATHALAQAPIVVDNVRAQLRGDRPHATYRSPSTARILLPLGARRGVGQLPTRDGGAGAAELDVVIRAKGADLFTARFAHVFAAPTQSAPVRAGRGHH